MKTRKFMALILSASMFLAACGGGSEGSTADDGNDKSQIAKIQIVAENNVESTEGLLSIESGNRTTLKLWAIYKNNESKEITRDVTWVVEPLGIIELGDNYNTTALAKSPGITSITASYNNLTTVESFIVSTPSTCFKTEKDTIKGLTEACNNEKILVIPPKINESVITDIGESAFYQNKKLQSVNMPSVETIGSRAFTYSIIKSVSMPLVTTIGVGAFSDTNLKNVSMPLVTTIGNGAFAMNGKLESVSMPLVESIGKLAFAFNKNLTSVIISNPELIDSYTFSLTPFESNTNYTCVELKDSNDNKRYHKCEIKNPR